MISITLPGSTGGFASPGDIQISQIASVDLSEFANEEVVNPRITESPGSSSSDYLLITNPTGGAILRVGNGRPRSTFADIGADRSLIRICTLGAVVLVADQGRRQVVALQGESGAVIWQYDVGGSIFDIIVASDSIIINALSNTPALFGLSFHYVSSNGELARSLADRDQVAVTQRDLQTRWLLARQPSGRVMAVSRSGSVLVSLDSQSAQMVGRLQPPSSSARIVDAYFDPGGLLWIAWAESTAIRHEAGRQFDDEVLRSSESYISVHHGGDFDTLSVRPIGGLLLGFTDAGSVYGYSRSLGAGTLLIWRAHLN